MAKVRVKVEDMSCESCIRIVTHQLELMNGVKDVAADAHHVVMAADVRLETGLVLHRLDLVDEAVPGEGRKRPVDGVERHGGYPLAQALMERLGRGMVGPQGELPVNLLPLVGEPEPCFPANPLEGPEPFLYRQAAVAVCVHIVSRRYFEMPAQVVISLRNKNNSYQHRLSSLFS
jgi:copper chaperone CopZ